MENIDKEYIIDKAMTSIASFAAAAKMTRAKLNGLISQPGVSEMSTEDVLNYLVEFMEKESEDMFKLYDSFYFNKVDRSVTYSELLKEAPLNLEDKESTIKTLRELCQNKNFSLVQVFNKDKKPKFVTIDEFERGYCEYLEEELRDLGSLKF